MSDTPATGDSALMRRLGGQFEELTHLLSQSHSGTLDPDRIVHVAGQAVAHSEDCALTLIEARRRPRTISSAGEISPRVDELQYEAGEGPCLEASETADFVHVDDLAHEPRWPGFADRCVRDTGVRSMFSVRLPLSGSDTAALNFYARSPGAFDDLDIGVGAIFAPFAALAVQAALHQQQTTNLETALQSSRQIGTAIGILMARELMTADQAFAQLTSASQHLNRKLRDIADEVATTGELPTAADRSRRRDAR
ncbi:hypothetical protein DQ244_05360 [Blastococcus sp. TBT05-19]|uniref:GAF and ANTAR domain-containing protein n=1 Tax=Blastococcus sp. TBT05-19 TaxID=2250581 RepID=UPI000DEA4C44|nr:GAF and ANTAR domain-containing protein [Blastococcus sp. TBT05-19]RBY94705.1 hypothetical protein DQ244_05360 [Blastococcus sp. TBT05-19]